MGDSRRAESSTKTKEPVHGTAEIFGRVHQNFQFLGFKKYVLTGRPAYYRPALIPISEDHFKRRRSNARRRAYLTRWKREANSFGALSHDYDSNTW